MLQSGVIIVVGAGLAGLACAKVLREAGRDVLLLEGGDGVGGRVRTDPHPDGYRLDRGFQVYFPAYPAARRHLDHHALRLRRFDPGGISVRNGRSYVLTDPVRDPLGALPATWSPAATPLDKLRVLLAKYDLGTMSGPELLAEDGLTVEEYLRARGFSPRFIELFARPFLGGILLRRDLGTSAAVFRYYWAMLSRGPTTVPAKGMGEISNQLAGHLSASAVRLGSRVDELVREDGRVAGVRTEGEVLRADEVVLAVDAPESRRLAGTRVPEGQVGSTTLYFAGDEPLWRGKKIRLNANPDAFVNDCAMISSVAPEYAPPGKHLLSASVLGTRGESDGELARRALDDLRRLVPPDRLETYRFLRSYRVTYAQFDQPPGFRSVLPKTIHPEQGLWLAGEYFDTSSINGAIGSGETTARALLSAA